MFTDTCGVCIFIHMQFAIAIDSHKCLNDTVCPSLCKVLQRALLNVTCKRGSEVYSQASCKVTLLRKYKCYALRKLDMT